MAEVERDEISGVDTTGHVWDGDLKELNNPLPRWWLSMFYMSIVWALVFSVFYPVWPMISTHSKGMLGYSTRVEVAEAVEAAKERQKEWRDQIESKELAAILEDPKLKRFAVRAGKAAYSNNCSQCHGSGAQGGPGYPNLNDDAWLWGGEIEEIYHSIKHGVRNEDSDEARISEMPVFSDDWLSPEEIKATAHYVGKLGNLEHDAALAATGAETYEVECSACHGENGEGDPSQGAPRLADAIWLFGSDLERIQSQIARPSHGVMPAWGLILDDNTVKQLAVYVHSLGGGQ